MSALTPARRRYIYRVLTTLGAVVIFYGVATGEEVALWLNVVATALLAGGTGLAAANTPTDDDTE